MPKSPPLSGVVGTLPLSGTAPTPINGESVDADDVQNLAQALLNQDDTLEAYINDGTKTINPGKVATGELNSAITKATGSLGVQFTGTQPAKNADPGAANIAIATLEPKAWGVLDGPDSGAVSLDDGCNIGSQTIISLSNEVVVTFARAMANANYSVTFAVEDDSSTLPICMINSKTTAGFHFNLWKSSDGSLVNLGASSGRKIHFFVIGRQ